MYGVTGSSFPSSFTIIYPGRVCGIIGETLPPTKMLSHVEPDFGLPVAASNLSLQTSVYSHPLQENTSLQYFFIVCLAMQCIFGTLGNFMVMGAVCVVPELRTTANAFIINLSVADLFVTSITQPSNIVGALWGEVWFQQRPVLCSVISTLCATGCLASTWNIFMISVNRYVLICHHDLYSMIYTPWKTFLLCLAVWILIYAIEIPNHFGWGDTRFSTVFYVCTFANHVHSYALFYIGVGVCIPVGVSFFAYLGIYLKVKDSSLVRNRLLSTREKFPSREERTHRKTNRRIFRQNVQMARALFRVYLIFLVMWLPVAVIVLLGRGHDVEPVWYILTILLAHGNSSINCVVYGASIDHFREGYLRILGFSKFSKSQRPRTAFGQNSVSAVTPSLVSRKFLTRDLVDGSQISRDNSASRLLEMDTIKTTKKFQFRGHEHEQTNLARTRDRMESSEELS